MKRLFCKTLVTVLFAIHKIVIKYGKKDTLSSNGYRLGVIRSMDLEDRSIVSSIDIGDREFQVCAYSPEYTGNSYEFSFSTWNPNSANWDE